MKRKPNLADVLKAVNRARKAMDLPPLRRIPKPRPGLAGSPLAQALEAELVCAASPPCPCCGYVSARAFVRDPSDARSNALRRLWPHADYRRMGAVGFWIDLPQTLSRFQWECVDKLRYLRPVAQCKRDTSPMRRAAAA